MSAAQLFVKADKTDNDMIKRIFTIYVKAQDTRNSNMKPKFFSQISDHQQSIAPVPSRDLPHTPSSAGGRWFSRTRSIKLQLTASKKQFLTSVLCIPYTIINFPSVVSRPLHMSDPIKQRSNKVSRHYLRYSDSWLNVLAIKKFF